MDFGARGTRTLATSDKVPEAAPSHPSESKTMANHSALDAAVAPSIGRRFAARVVDGVVQLVVIGGAAAVVLISAIRSSDQTDALGGLLGSALLVSAIATVLAVFEICCMTLAGATLGGVLLGVFHVDTRTGQMGGSGTFVKYFIKGLLAGWSLAIVDLLVTLMSMDSQARQSWFDRTAHVQPIDIERTAPGVLAAIDPYNKVQVGRSMLLYLVVSLPFFGLGSAAVVGLVTSSASSAMGTLAIYFLGMFLYLILLNDRYTPEDPAGARHSA
jgi:hypothetical protein